MLRNTATPATSINQAHMSTRFGRTMSARISKALPVAAHATTLVPNTRDPTRLRLETLSLSPSR